MSQIGDMRVYDNVDNSHYSTVVKGPSPTPPSQSAASSLQPDADTITATGMMAAAAMDKAPEVILLCSVIVRQNVEREELRRELQKARRNAERAASEDTKEEQFLRWLTNGLEENDRRHYLAHRSKRFREHVGKFDELQVVREWQDQIAEQDQITEQGQMPEEEDQLAEARFA
jgi:hypothetical protein